MSNNTESLIAAATIACGQIKAVKESNKEAAEIVFIESALATHAATRTKGSAAKLAASNKAAGVGYGSEAAVNFHALTGAFLLLDNEDFEGSASSIQTLIKKVGQVESKAIIAKAKTQDIAAERLASAVSTEVDIVKELKKALLAVSNAEQARLEGNALPTEADEIVASIRLALGNVVLGDAPIETETFRQIDVLVTA